MGCWGQYRRAQGKPALNLLLDRHRNSRKQGGKPLQLREHMAQHVADTQRLATACFHIQFPISSARHVWVCGRSQPGTILLQGCLAWLAQPPPSGWTCLRFSSFRGAHLPWSSLKKPTRATSPLLLLLLLVLIRLGKHHHIGLVKCLF